MSEYKRLTKKDEKGRWVAEAGSYGIYLDNKVKADMMHGELISRLAELENMIEKIGKYSLPVGIGDTAYYVYRRGGYTELKIQEISFERLEVWFLGESDSDGSIGFILADFGVCVFLTEEEAQKKSEEWSR